ncbi:GNAT family N-acetyltransferase [Streptacidiphilus jiangxiensis]|uniref:GNAT family N-acetyltransferase n=1 Tax=Streptacidiphilus jiangxiensis TaxID=235985 RepID=UPI00137844B7|nr:GNAT family N-acetyltransferase [Streptacidiphilus jiangxiensis]
MVTISQEGPLRWTAWREGLEIGSLLARVRPDQRCFLLHRGSSDTRGLLLDAALGAFEGDLYGEVDEADADGLDDLCARGFVVHRREHHYLLPTDPGRTGLAQHRSPTSLTFLPVQKADADRWRKLDDALRQDVPGTAGWRNDPDRFAEETFGDPEFDPTTYLLAVDGTTGEYIGLIRVWNTSTGPRLGLIGTLPGHRRRGVALALMAEVFDLLHRRGRTHVHCEVDTGNVASDALMIGIGAERVGGTVELVRRRPATWDRG